MAVPGRRAHARRAARGIRRGAPDSQGPGRDLSWETGEGHSYFIPAFEIAGFIAGLNVFNRFLVDSNTYGTDWHSFRKNLTSAQVIDDDPFSVNQIGHPYQGSIYYGFARWRG